MRKSGINLGTPLSVPVADFAQKMDERLDENAHRDKIGWHDISVDNAAFLIKRNLAKVRIRADVLNRATPEVNEANAVRLKEEILKDCADIGNYAMMIADNVKSGRYDNAKT
jgi:hypothetical protein